MKKIKFKNGMLVGHEARGRGIIKSIKKDYAFVRFSDRQIHGVPLAHLTPIKVDCDAR